MSSSTSVNEILQLASSDSRSQANGGSTNTNGTEASQTTFSNHHDSTGSIPSDATPEEAAATRLDQLSLSERSPSIFVSSLMQEATPAKIEELGLNSFVYENTPNNTQETSSSGIAAAEAGNGPNGTRGSSQDTTSTPASSLLQPGHINIEDL